MRQHIIYISLVLTLALSACEKTFLDKEPMDSLGSEFVLKTQDGMDMLLNGAYDRLQSYNWYGGMLYLYEAAKGPDFFVRNVSGGYSFYTENRYAESSTYNGNARSLWLTLYNVILNTTMLLENIDDVPGDVSELRRIKGEAYALRGLAYFDLCRLFAYPPKYSCTWGSSYQEDFKWGVPLLESAEMGADITDYEVRRATADESWAYIQDQFEKAFKLLHGQWVQNGHVGAAAVKILQSRVALFMERYADAVKICNDWLGEYSSSYSLIPYESYPTQYYKPFNSESVWEIKYTESDNLSSYSINYWVRHPTYDIPGNPLDGEVSQNIGYAKLGLTYGNSLNGLESMRSYSADVRQCLICSMGIQGKDYHTIRRYVGEPYHFVHNVPVVRLPEVYMNLAEAYWECGNESAAKETLSIMTRIRRKADASISTVNNILNERRREFILEGQTYWDFFRKGRNITNRPVMESIGSGSSIKFGNPTGLSYRVVYPIPLSEMNANPDIRDQQNPGYAEWKFGVEDEN